MDYREDIKKYIELEIETLNKLDVEAISRAITLLEETWDAEGTVYVMGNGGSAATAAHYQNDFNKGISEHVEKKFRFQCLNDNVPTVMAIANDIGFDEVFRFQLLNKLQQKDIVLALSASGNSQNVINAVTYAKKCGCKVIGLTGYTGGILAGLSDVSLNVPVMSMQVTEDIHMVLDHLMMSIFYSKLCGKNHVEDQHDE